jgi:site-specific DNA recombinase
MKKGSKNTEQVMKAVAYVRVSSDDQVKGTSLDSQTDACVGYAKSNSIELPTENIFREEGVSAKIMDRPKLAAMLDYCAKNKGKITHCIIWKVDRLARRSEYHHIIKAQLAKVGVKLVSVTEPISDDPMGNLMESMLAAFAQFDNEIRLARTTGGMIARLEQGAWPHAAPVGYSRTRTATGIVTIEPNAEAPKMKRLLEEFSTGAYTVQNARDYAHKIGIRNRTNGMRTWQMIKDMLGNPLYAGFVTSGYIDGRLIRGLHEPIISEATYYRNQAILNGSLRNFSRSAEEEWPLRSGFLQHTCGKAMTGSSPRGRSGPSPRYSCMFCKAKEMGISVSKMRGLVHQDFMDLMERVRPTEDAQKLFKHIVLREWNNETRDSHNLARTLDSELNALQDKRMRTLDLYIDNKISETDKDRKLAEVDNDITKVELRRAEITDDIKDKEQVIDNALLFMSNPASFWNLAPIEVKRRIQDAIFPEGLVYDCDTGFRTAKLAESYLLIQKIPANNAEIPCLVAPTRIELVTSGL